MYWILCVLGLFVMIVPIVLGLGANTAAIWACIILGAVVVLLAGYEATAKDPPRREVVLVMIAGCLAAINPFLLGFSSNWGSMWASIILGLVIAFLAGVDIYHHDPMG